MTPSRVSVVCTDERTEPDDQHALDPARWSRLAEQVLIAEGAVGELTLTFIDEVDIAELNARYMGKTGSTDVLSFPLDDPDDESDEGDAGDDDGDDGDGGDALPGVPTLLGDVVISPAVAARQFAGHAGTFDDEIALLVVHGVLHVLGHDHAELGEAEVMRARELDHLIANHWNAPAPAGFRQTHD